jgi:predicted Zn-dependent protease
MVILGCASTPPSPPFVDRTLRTEAGSPADVTGTPALDALRAAAREEVGQPVALGGDGFGVTRVPPAEFTVGPRANATVAEALDALLASRNDAPPSPGPGGMTDAERAAALSAYSAGREALIRGDADTAIDELERASRLDPGSPAVWRSLAEAQLQVGLRASERDGVARSCRIVGP